jgi:hypothetical protein
VVWIAVIGVVGETVTSAISDVNFSNNFPELRDPVAIGAPFNAAYNLATTVQPLVFVLGAIAMIVRFRRAGAEQRQQLKWFMYATAVAAAVLLVAANLSNNPLPASEITAPLIPAAMGVAILKYRPYDIDRIISRTVAYAIVTGLLAGVYAGLVLLATQVLAITSPVAVARPPSPPRCCSPRCAGACSGWWTAGSTGSATTPTRPSPPSPPGPGTPSTSTRSGPTCWPWSTPRSSPPTSRSGPPQSLDSP